MHIVSLFSIEPFKTYMIGFGRTDTPQNCLFSSVRPETYRLISSVGEKAGKEEGGRTGDRRREEKQGQDEPD